MQGRKKMGRKPKQTVVGQFTIKDVAHARQLIVRLGGDVEKAKRLVEALS
jgi:hypothetical protein